MSVTAYVMPLSNYLSGYFDTPDRPFGDRDEGRATRRTPDEVRQGIESLLDQLERLLAFRPEWDDAGPVRSAVGFSIEGFFAPFMEARRTAYRRKMPLLTVLEPPQIWIPPEFDPAVQIVSPWSPQTEWFVASSSRVHSELVRLLLAIEGEERPDLAEAHRVTGELIKIAALSVEHDTPVIVEI